MKKILITGAARGLGAALRDFLLAKGYYVYGTTRDCQNVTTAKNLEFLSLDLTDKASIDSLSDYFNDKSLDAIIHNSGIAYLDPADVLEDEERRHIFDVNFFGPVYLTQKLLPLMRKANKGTLIFISSIVSIDPWPYLGVYAASKAALETVAFEWAVLLKKWNIDVSIIQPNPLPTDMQICRSKNANKSPYPSLENRLLEWENIEDVCKIIYSILRDPSPKFSYQTGHYSKSTADNILKETAYQFLLEKHQNIFKELNKE